ncbi:hypothetical protein C8R46DRAFT_1117923 [Mycena filopes]|nr:hypothetical protein C8R46DRAFT_1117923 [Mycena filopes]
MNTLLWARVGPLSLSWHSLLPFSFPPLPLRLLLLLPLPFHLLPCHQYHYRYRQRLALLGFCRRRTCTAHG